MSKGCVRYTQRDGVGHLLIDNAAAYNAFDDDMWQELADHCTAIAADRSVRVVTIGGAGEKAFAAGNDIHGFLSFRDGMDGVAYEKRVGACIEALENLPQPTVALIRGWAVGGGLAIALSCDFRIAAAGARFGSPIARTLGNSLCMRNYARILSHLGPALTKRMLLLAEIMTAEELQPHGLLEAVVEPDALDATAAALCDRLKQNAPLSLHVTKEALRRLTYANLPDMDDLIALAYGSEDFRHGVASFLAKTKPQWTGR
ncbi:MAG: enoyl-CoA hydratase [Sphingobium sp.]